MADTAPTSTAVASPAATTETKSDERSFSILKFIAYFLALGANAAACFMLLHCLNSETFWTVGTNNTSFYPTTNNYLTVAQEAATRYIGATFFIFVVTYFFIHDEIFYADGTNFARIFLNSNIPFKTAIAVGVTVQFAESFFRLAAVWACWEDKWGVPSTGLQGATWGILFLASLLTYVALIAQHNTALTYPETLSGVEVPAACGWFAPIVHVLAFLANGVQIVVFVVALGKGTEKLLNPFAATTTSNKAGTATLVTYQYVNQSLLTQYLMSAIAGLFLAFYHFVRSFKGSFADSLPKNVQDFVVNGPKLVFAVEAFLRIIAFIRLQVNIPNQSTDEQIVSGQWVILLIATLLQFISSWAAAHTEYIEARVGGKAVASADSEKADTSRNIFFGIAAAVAWPLWLNSRP